MLDRTVVIAERRCQQPQIAVRRAITRNAVIYDDWTGMGQRTTASGTTEFDNVLVPDELLIATTGVGEGSGGGNLTSLLYQAVHTAVFVVLARTPSTIRSTFSRRGRGPWYQSVSHEATKDPYSMLHVGEVKMAVEASELLALHAADLCDQVVANPGDPEIRGLASLATGEARKAAADAAMHAGATLSRCAIRAVFSRSTGSIGIGATHARCRFTIRLTSRQCTPEIIY